MEKKNRPHDYDVPAWLAFYQTHPNFHRSVGADGDGDGDGSGEGDGEGDGDGAGGGDGDGNGGDDNWRTQFAGGDDKRATQLERYTTPADFGNAYFEAQSKLTSAELLKPLPDDATDEDLTAFRKQQGIPLEPKAYLEDLPDGLVIGEDDMPFMEAFVTDMHEVNLLPTQAHKIIAWYNGFVEKADAERHDIDDEIKTETEDALRDEWKSDYRKNMNLIGALIEGQFGETAENFLNARTGDGTPLMSHPGILRGLINLAREINPAALIVTGDTDPNQSLDDEISKLEKLMGDRSSAYWKGPDAENNQKRLTQLYEARIARENRGKAA